MITNAARKERTNMTSALATSETIVVYTVSSNRSFILTDLQFDYAGAGLKIFDSIVATAAPTAAQTKMQFRVSPVVMTDIKNGPEFGLGVSVMLDDPNHAMPTYGVWIGGYER